MYKSNRARLIKTPATDYKERHLILLGKSCDSGTHQHLLLSMLKQQGPRECEF
jgi:hypoxanthine-guanine phosphoribosyltransferase